MSATRWIANPHFEEGIAADVATRAVIAARGQIALDGARNAVAVRTGHARDAYYFDDSTMTLGSTSSFWLFDEYGSVHNAPTAPLRRGCEAAAVHWSDSR